MISEKNNFSVKLKNCELWSDEPECWSKNFSYFSSSLLWRRGDETSEAAWHKHISNVWQPPPEVSLEVPLLSSCHFHEEKSQGIVDLQSFYGKLIMYICFLESRVKKRQLKKKWFRRLWYMFFVEMITLSMAIFHFN